MVRPQGVAAQAEVEAAAAAAAAALAAGVVACQMLVWMAVRVELSSLAFRWRADPSGAMHRARATSHFFTCHLSSLITLASIDAWKGTRLQASMLARESETATL